MDTGEFIYIVSRLLLGAAASFLAIMFWSKTRDAAWMLVVLGTVTAYIETVYSILILFGITGFQMISIGSMPLPSIILPNLPVVFYCVAFGMMVSRKLPH